MRSPEVQSLIDRLSAAFAGGDLAPPARAALDKVFDRLATPAEAGAPAPSAPAVTRHLDQALAPLLVRQDALAPLAQTLNDLAPRLAWAARTSGGPHASANFAGNHANAMLIGPGGLEVRTDVWIGASLMAPDTRYPDHDHPPEEVYIALSPGDFLHGDEDWTPRLPGQTFYNTPGIRHAMRSGAVPLLAIWCLPI